MVTCFLFLFFSLSLTSGWYQGCPPRPAEKQATQISRFTCSFARPAPQIFVLAPHCPLEKAPPRPSLEDIVCILWNISLLASKSLVVHCCLAPCKSVPNYGPLTEPKIYIVKFGRTAISTLNGRISETKRDFLDPLVPKFSYDRGLSPTLSWKWPSATLSPSFGLFQSEKPLFWGVPGVSRRVSLVRICPRDLFTSRKKNYFAVTLQKNLPQNFVISFVEVFSLIFTQPAWKHIIYWPPSPLGGERGWGSLGWMSLA